MAAEEDNTKVKSVAVILAAGSSSRMGQSKQLLEIGNESLLRKTVRTVIASGVDKIIVLLGSNQEVHHQEIIDLPVLVVFNSDWQKGMGASLKCGVHFVSENFPSCDSILVTVCDQPLLTTDHLKKMIGAFQVSTCPIIASFYSNSPGVPALFARSLFKDLLDMDDQHGAKKIINNNVESVRLIEFPEGAIDLDTPDDLRNFERSP